MPHLLLCPTIMLDPDPPLMTYITRIANKRILAKYFLYSLQINYLHWKLSASRSIFSCYATFEFCMLRATLCQLERIMKSKILEATTDGSEKKTQTVTSNAMAAS